MAGRLSRSLNWKSMKGTKNMKNPDGTEGTAATPNTALDADREGR